MGGVKTPEGKSVSKFNAITHGVLRQSLTDYEEGIYQDLLRDLLAEINPVGILETILVERVALSYVRLFRVAKVEKEYVLSQLTPRIESSPLDSFLNEGKTVAQEEYKPKIFIGSIAQIDNTVLHYETTIERSLYKALHEIQRIQSARRGEKPPLPLAVDVVIDKSNYEINPENGFVSQNDTGIS